MQEKMKHYDVFDVFRRVAAGHIFRPFYLDYVHTLKPCCQVLLIFNSRKTINIWKDLRQKDGRWLPAKGHGPPCSTWYKIRHVAFAGDTKVPAMDEQGIWQ